MEPASVVRGHYHWLAPVWVLALSCTAAESPAPGQEDRMGAESDDASAGSSATGGRRDGSQPSAPPSSTGTDGGQSSESRSYPQPVIDHSAWESYDAADDPFRDHRPALVECGTEGWQIEAGTLEIQTEFCNYAALAHPSLVDIPAGSTLSVSFWHLLLTAPEPAQAHVALAFGEDVAWETYVDIPRDTDIVEQTFTLDHPVEAGVPVRFHLHNHGQNSWTFASLAIVAGP